MKKPLLSILIPTYNYASYIGEALDSVLEQTFTDFEIVVVDDASVDRTDEVCRRFVESDPRVRYVRNASNVGMVQNWNRSVSLAQGQYLKLLLADDKLRGVDALALQIRALEANPDIALVTSSRAIIDETSRLLEIWDPLGRSDRVVQLGEIEAYMLARVGRGMNFIGEPSAVMFRARDAESGFSENLRQLVDFEMWLRLMSRGDLYYFAQPLCAFRRHSHQQSALNSQAGLGELEELEIVSGHFRDRPGGRRRLARVRRMVWKLWQNSSNPLLRTEADAMGRDLSAWIRAWSWLEYRLRRASENLARLLSGRSRRSRRLLRHLTGGSSS